MDGDRTISQTTFGQDARIHQGDAVAYIEGSVSVTNNYGISPATTNKRDGEDDVLRRLYTTPYEDRKNRNPTRVPGTCEWFTSHELFKEWQDSRSSRLLWVSADPGCGKFLKTRALAKLSAFWMRLTNAKIKGLSSLKNYANFMALRMTFISSFSLQVDLMAEFTVVSDL
ncbi:hypothetical protein ACHAPE_007190 [Trichoderma viride]